MGNRTMVGIVGLVLLVLGFAMLGDGVTTLVARSDTPAASADGFLVAGGGPLRAVLGLVALALGLTLLDRGFGRGLRSTPPTLRIASVPVTHGDAVALVAAVQEEYVARYGGPDDTPLEPSTFLPPGGCFFVGYLGERAAVTGAWRLRDDVPALGSDRVGEIKRMYVVPAAQRQGHGRRMLAHLEATLREAGAEVAILETGIRQPEAIALYRASGYVEIDKFGHYRDAPESVCFGKRL